MFVIKIEELYYDDGILTMCRQDLLYAVPVTSQEQEKGREAQ